MELTGDIAGRVLCSGGLAGARGRLAETGRGGAEGRQGAAGGGGRGRGQAGDPPHTDTEGAPPGVVAGELSEGDCTKHNNVKQKKRKFVEKVN